MSMVNSSNEVETIKTSSKLHIQSWKSQALKRSGLLALEVGRMGIDA